jgi:hypothetical protein
MTLDIGRLRLRGTKVAADIAAAVTGLTVDAAQGTVAQLTLTVDDGGVLARSGLAQRGSTVVWDGQPWQIATTTARWGRDSTQTHEVECRSPLARTLRRSYRASAERQVSPSEWVARRVAAAGGVAVCQPSARRSTIAQMSGDERQSELDVITSLASDLGWDWVELDGRLLFGSPHTAWTSAPAGQRTWPVTWSRSERSDALEADITVDDDDPVAAATGTVTVPSEAGDRVRPWDLLLLAGFGSRDGRYLVTSITRSADPAADAVLQVAQPRQESTKDGSSR